MVFIQDFTSPLEGLNLIWEIIRRQVDFRVLWGWDTVTAVFLDQASALS